MTRRGGRRIRTYAVPLVCLLVLAIGCIVYINGPFRPPPPKVDPVSGPTPVPTTPAARTRHVAVSGQDSAAGTAKAPLRTIEAAIKAARAGDTIIVHSGAYHEQLKVENREGLTIMAAPGAKVWLDGSTEVTRWKRTGSVWVAKNWHVQFDHSPTFRWGAPDNVAKGWQFIDPAHPMAAHPDQVWVDGRRQKQVESLDRVEKGTFFVDEGQRKLYLGGKPKGRTVRASSLAQAMRIRSDDTTIRGIGVRNYAPSVPHMGAVTIEADHVTIEHLAVVDNATTGLHVMGRSSRIIDVQLKRNGMMGLSATNADDLFLDHITVRRNNVERFNPSPSAGGVKVGRTTGVEVRDSLFEGNLGTGLWFDESVYDIGVLNSRLLRNSGHGLSIELSGKADVVGNIIADNDQNGAKINNSDHIQLWNNTFVRNDRPINIVQDIRDIDPQGSYLDPTLPLSWQTRDVAIRNNIIIGSSGNCLLCVEDYSDRFKPADLNVTAASNVYYRHDDRKPRWLVVWARGPKEPYIFKSLSQFRVTVAQETPGGELTGPSALSSSYVPKESITRLVASLAQPLPEDLALRIDVPAETQHLGAWV